MELDISQCEYQYHILWDMMLYSWHMLTNILKELTAFIFRADLKWNVPSKHWYISTVLHGVTFQKKVILTSNL
jgi:hypothetical protein